MARLITSSVLVRKEGLYGIPCTGEPCEKFREGGIEEEITFHTKVTRKRQCEQGRQPRIARLSRRGQVLMGSAPSARRPMKRGASTDR